MKELEAAIKPTTILIAIMYANNEIGTVMPMKEISALAKKKGILVFSDATQAVGKIPVDVNKDGIDLMAFTAHKIWYHCFNHPWVTRSSRIMIEIYRKFQHSIFYKFDRTTKLTLKRRTSKGYFDYQELILPKS